MASIKFKSLVELDVLDSAKLRQMVESDSFAELSSHGSLK